MEKATLTAEQTAKLVLSAASELADPATGTNHVSGRVISLTGPSLLDQLALMVIDGPTTRKAAAGGSSHAGSRPPLCIEAMELRDGIIGRANREASRLANTSRWLGAPADAVKAWAGAAARHSLEEATLALRTIRGWIRAIKAMQEPPVLKELVGTCGECGNSHQVTANGGRVSALVIDVREGGQSRVSCQVCEASWTPEQTRAIGAYATGSTVEEVDARVKAAATPTPIKRHPDAETVLGDVTAYAEEHGHLPPNNSADPVEARLAQWIRTRTNPKRQPSSEQGIIIRAAVLRLVTKYPSAAQAKLAATEKSTDLNTLEAA